MIDLAEFRYSKGKLRERYTELTTRYARLGLDLFPLHFISFLTTDLKSTVNEYEFTSIMGSQTPEDQRRAPDGTQEHNTSVILCSQCCRIIHWHCNRSSQSSKTCGCDWAT